MPDTRQSVYSYTDSMEDSLAFSQELPQPQYRYRGKNSSTFHTESTPLVEQSVNRDETVSGEDDDESISHKKLKPMVYGVFTVSALSSFLWGYNLSVIAGAMLLISEHFHLDVLWHSVIVSILIGGATVGAATAGMLSDRFGRWKVMVMAAVLLIAGALVMGFAPSKECLAVGRAISGIGVGESVICSHS